MVLDNWGVYCVTHTLKSVLCQLCNQWGYHRRCPVLSGNRFGLRHLLSLKEPSALLRIGLSTRNIGTDQFPVCLSMERWWGRHDDGVGSRLHPVSGSTPLRNLPPAFPALCCVRGVDLAWTPDSVDDISMRYLDKRPNMFLTPASSMGSMCLARCHI